ncbi:MAG: hypothetical protein ACRD3P_07680 [Terriglobales bacterium]
MGQSVATPQAIADHHSGLSGLADQVVHARIELYACLQLLADRARFVTGATWAAIALHERNEFIYCAVAGNSGPVIGSEFDVKTLRPEQSLGADGKSLLVTVIRNSKTAGFFQLYSETAKFSDQDLQSVIRLADMVATAINCMEAEQNSIADENPSVPALVAQPPKPAVPVLWHAPDNFASGESSRSSSTSNSAVSVHACESCGFPVSRDRTICVDCEDRGTPAATMARLLTASHKKEESWLSAHGYTIASLLVSALVFAIIYWLR